MRPTLYFLYDKTPPLRVDKQDRGVRGLYTQHTMSEKTVLDRIESEEYHSNKKTSSDWMLILNLKWRLVNFYVFTIALGSGKLYQYG